MLPCAYSVEEPLGYKQGVQCMYKACGFLDLQSQWLSHCGPLLR